MWSHPRWAGRYFPADTVDQLEAYATWCNAVEGNTTFYAVPSSSSVARWSDHAPADFRFCFKLPRTITHDRRLRHAREELHRFLEAIAPLADRSGPVQIQLPPSFGPDGLPALDEFVQRLSSDWWWAVEVRHPEFFPGGSAERPLNDLMAAHGVNRVLLDSRPLFSGPCRTPGEIEAFANKPRVGVRPVATGTAPLVRFIGLTDLDDSAVHWQQWLPKVAQWLRSGLRPYFFAHTPDNLDAPSLARRFHGDVAELVPDLDPLPTPRRVDQLDLF